MCIRDSIYNELRDDCGVQVPKQVSIDDIGEFVDMKLQHGRNSLGEDPCKMDIKEVKPPASSWSTDKNADIVLYQDCIKLYCALEDGSAYLPNFVWNMEIRS